MADINFIGSTSLGKITRWEAKKASTITPISFPGKDSGRTEGIDTLGVIAYINFDGQWTGSFDEIQGNIHNIQSIADGQQVSAQTLKSPFVNAKDFDDNRRQGTMGTNTSYQVWSLIDSTATFMTNGIQKDDIVKNMTTNETATVLSDPTAEDELALSVDIFPNTGTPYAVTATIHCKIIDINVRWELPGLNYCFYQISIIQVA